MIDRWVNAIILGRWFVIAITAILVATAGVGIKNLEFKVDYRELFPKNAPYVDDFIRLQDTFITSDTALIVISSKDEHIFNRDALHAIESFTRQSWTLPHVSRVDSITNFQHTKAVNDELTVDSLVENVKSLTDEEISGIKKTALNEKQLIGRLLSEDGHTTGIMLTINLPGKSNIETEEIALAIRALANKYRESHPDLDIYLTGMIMGNYASAEVVTGDAQFLIPMMGLIIIATLALMLRSVTATLMTIVVLVFTLITATGLLGWFGYYFTGPSSSAPVIILTMAVADCVHVLVSFFFARGEGLNKRNAIRESMRLNMMPIFLTSLTTGIGFLSMNFSEMPPFKLLGNVVALGVAIAFILSITFLPALMSVIPMRKPRSNKTESNLLKPLSDFVLRQRIRLFWGLSVSCIFIMLFIPNNEINDQFVKFFDPKVEFRHSSDFASEHLSSLYSLEYAFVSPDDGGVYSVKFLKDLELFNEWLLKQDEVQQTMSIVDIMKQINKSMHNDQDNWYRLPDNRELAAQYFLMYEFSLPYGLDLTNQIDFTKTETRVLLTLKELSTQEMLAFESRANQWIDTHLRELEYYQSSPTILFSHLGMNNAKSMLVGSVLALLIISTIITFALRSIRLGAVSIISNMVPAGLAFGLWGIFVGQIGISVAIAIGMTLGIVVDNTVHFLSKYLHARRQLRGTSEIAIGYAFSHVGKAILICNLVLIAGFVVLAQSNLRLNAYMGYFTALTFVMALVIDFLLLPPILMFIDKKIRAT
ncbi:MAG: MMPL family transporter [Pseudomonadales bacterium]|nr:MMPL family transporter [Pseudomonadales bacterium]